MTAAFPGACGRANLAMLQPTIPGYKVETVGTTTLHGCVREPMVARQPRGRLLRCCTGTSYKTSPMAMETARPIPIFTNVALTAMVTCGGRASTVTFQHLIDWHGNDWTPESGEGCSPEQPLHRSASRADHLPRLGSPEGVAVDAVLFPVAAAPQRPAGRSEQYGPAHGVFIGASVASEVTAATTNVKAGSLPVTTRFAMPFCGLRHGLGFTGTGWRCRRDKLWRGFPKVYQVNWFRKDEDDSFMARATATTPASWTGSFAAPPARSRPSMA